MAAQPVVDAFYTTVRYMGVAPRSFGFLGVHGRRLRSGQQYTVPGDLVTVLAARFQSGEANRRHFQAFERAVDRGDLVLVNTPAVHLYDQTRDETKTLRINNGSLGAVDPSWGEYSSSLYTLTTP